jgi:hypothetical protein
LNLDPTAHAALERSMNKLRQRLPLVIVFSLGWFNAGPLQAGTPVAVDELTVRVFRLASVQDGTLSAAERTAEWIFRAAGIALRWSDCGRPSDCPSMPLTLAIVLKLFPRALTEQSGLPPGKFGVALPNQQVYVFFDRVEAITPNADDSRPKVLGHVMAHELGHILLPGEGHSVAGIMSEQLLSQQCERPGIMRLVFSPEQGRRMRARIQSWKLQR